MRFSSILSLTTVGLIAAAAQGQATMQFDGSDADSDDWNIAANWTITAGSDTDGIPDLDDTVIVPTGFSVQIEDAHAYADTLSIRGNSSVTVQAFTLEVDGGGGASAFEAANALKLDNVNATLKISGSQTWQPYNGSSTASLQLDDAGALIEIASGVTFTTQIMVHGFGSIAAVSGASVTPTLYNQHSVVADVASSTLELFSDVILDDQDGSPDSLWKATGTSAKLQFKRAAILDGDVLVESGAVLDFQATMRFTGGTDATFTFNGGSVTVDSGKTFDYDNFAGSCANPDASGPPYSLDSSGSPYGCS